jgi:hypothetical protein
MIMKGLEMCRDCRRRLEFAKVSPLYRIVFAPVGSKCVGWSNGLSEHRPLIGTSKNNQIPYLSDYHFIKIYK